MTDLQKRLSEIKNLVILRRHNHEQNRSLWINGALRPTVESDEEAFRVMEGLEGAINEDNKILEYIEEMGIKLP